MNNHYISIIRRSEQAFLRNELEKYGLSPLESRIICTLRKHSFTQEELGACLDIDKGRIAKGIFSLEEKGYIERIVNEKNRRQKIVSLTESGKSIYEKISSIYDIWNQICYNGFSEIERVQNQQFVERITANIAAYKKRGGDLNG